MDSLSSHPFSDRPILTGPPSSMKITTIVSLAIGLAGWQATVQARDAVPPQTRKGASPAVAQASPDGNMVLIPASQARDIQRATREVSDCVRIEDDMSRLGCYDEVMARRLPQPDRDLPKLKAWGLRTPAAGGQGGHPPSDQATRTTGAGQGERQPATASGQSAGKGMEASGASGGVQLIRLPNLGASDDTRADEDNDSSRGKLLLDGSHVSRAVQDVRRSLGADLTDRWELDDDANRGRFLLRPYKPMYISFVDWTTSLNTSPHTPNPLNTVGAGNASMANQGRHAETTFQISFKSKVAENLFGDNGDLWVGYTQRSMWQIYSQQLSRPFRETNYEPEVMAVFRTNYRLGGWHGRLASVSLNHHSNGRSLPLSRSWNRIIFQAGLERERWTLLLRPWWRIPEDANDDDNPDINDYYGRGEAVAIYRHGGHEWALTVRHSLRVGHSHGSVGLEHAFPISSYLKAHINLFHGYGASLIDYNHRQTRIGIGVSLTQWL